jgi:hypothetical protein
MKRIFGASWRKMAQDDALSTKQARAIGALLASRTVTDAAQEAGISARQLHRWLAEPAFLAELQRAETAVIEHTTRRLSTATTQALDTVIRVMESGSSDSVKLRAAIALLDTTLRWHELRAIEVRLAALEAATMSQAGER